MHLKWCSIVIVAVMAATGLHAQEATPEQLQQYVKELGDDNFDKRQNAEKELAKAGLKAKDALTAAAASGDAQVKATAKRLLGRIKFATMGTINYLDIIPASALIVGDLPSVEAILKDVQGTSAGKMVLSEPLKAFRDAIAAEMEKNPDGKKQFDLWTSRFKGQFAGAVWELNLMAGPAGIKAAALAELTTDDPNGAYKELVGLLIPDGGEASTYKDVEITSMPRGEGALALVGKNVILASNIDAAKVLIDNMLTPPAAGANFTTAAPYVKAKPSLGAKPEMMFALDIQGYIKVITAIMPMPGVEDMMSSSGLKDMRMMFYTSAITAESFEDRFVSIMEGQASGFRAASIPPADAPAPLETLGVVPANAVAAGVGYLDGAKMTAALTEYLAAMKKMMDAQKEMMGGGPGKDPMAELQAFEAKAGIKVADFLGNLKGAVAYWTVLAPNGGMGAPDIGALFTCVDAEKAKATAALLAKAINTGTGKEAVKEVAVKTRTIYQIDLPSIDANITPAFPYPSPCFAVEGNRVFLASSSQALQKHLNNLDAKAPGLLTHPDFVKAMGSLKPEERKGQIMYADTKSLLILAGNAGLPLLAAQPGDEEFKKVIGMLPPPAEMFKDVPPVIVSATDRGDRSEIIIRGPVPPMPTMIGLVMALTFARQSAAMRAMEMEMGN